jgi:hypothetical protein
VEDADEPVSKNAQQLGGEWLDGKTCPVVERSGNSGVPDTGEGLGECECIKALVGGQPHEPVDAAGASQPLELVLACVF